jgi:hypothetical protein
MRKTMPWSFAHYGVLWDYWYRTQFSDWGDRNVENSFAKRVAEMLGEEAHNDPWSEEMRRAFVDFCDTFYEFPVQLELSGTTASGQPIYAQRVLGKSYAEALKAGRERLTLRRVGPHDPRTVLSMVVSGTAYPEKAQDEAVLRAFMRVWHLRGFIPVAATQTHQLTAQPAPHFLSRFAQSVQNSRGAATLANLASQCFSTTQNAVFAWRGDTRSWADVSAATGLHCKVISNNQGYLDWTNLKKPWHVFHEDRFRNHMYFRRNSKDNCLDTAVSISIVGHVDDYEGDEFKTSTTFPQLKLFTEDKRTRLTVKYRQRGSNATVQGPKYVDHVRLYLCRLPAGTRFFDTYKAQGLWGASQFPECAVRGIPLQEIYGYITFVRVHHGNGQEMDEGFDAFPVEDPKHSKLVRDAHGAGAVFRAAFVPFSRRWLESGSEEVESPAAEYLSVGNGKVTNGRLRDVPMDVGWVTVRSRHQRPEGRVRPQPPPRRDQQGNRSEVPQLRLSNRFEVLQDLDDTN